MQRGLLIAFEGIDGTGKTTQIKMLASALNDMGLQTVVTREPTDGPYGKRIRELYVSREGVSAAEELALFIDDRRQHVRELIEPSLVAGKVVLTDRYYLSTAAYQGVAGHDPEVIIAQNELFAPIPDLVFLLKVPPALGVHRILDLRGEALNDFEQEAGLQKVDQIFDQINRPYIKRIDATRTVPEVHADVMSHIQILLYRKGTSCGRISLDVS
ncbi:MAG: dTMP kinase [Proteobacteria bacterium]|nr:dTMP kinase [Pseudomonadota bacterium]MBU1714288.1 dTMP kinase [Pseudomonadota bacterium]